VRASVVRFFTGYVVFLCRISPVGELSREEKWSLMLDNNKELLASFRKDVLTPSCIAKVAMETYETLNQWAPEQLRGFSEICIPLLLIKEQREFVRGLCRFKELRHYVHDIEVIPFK
jgi:hypothetical protein